MARQVITGPGRSIVSRPRWSGDGPLCGEGADLAEFVVKTRYAPRSARRPRCLPTRGRYRPSRRVRRLASVRLLRGRNGDDFRRRDTSRAYYGLEKPVRGVTQAENTGPGEHVSGQAIMGPWSHVRRQDALKQSVAVRSAHHSSGLIRASVNALVGEYQLQPHIKPDMNGEHIRRCRRPMSRRGLRSPLAGPRSR
jgi:hypothetical protein